MKMFFYIYYLFPTNA